MAEFGRRRRKICLMCAGRVELDYKNPEVLKKFVNEKGKILSRRATGTCARHQREVSKTIKRARAIALMPYTK
ncbi:MAG: 30S ribosomal protein S18 [Bacilli bacterium]|nr:30S ribosomal protein S18 [Bacilli bacterium]MBR3049274.1 30S ribosomal protein S18 [Bacilli bacterium]